jgi:hypothetical protein
MVRLAQIYNGSSRDGSFRYLSQHGLGGRGIGRIDQYSNPNGSRHQIMQEPQPFGTNFTEEKIEPGRIAARPGEIRDETYSRWVFGDAEDDWDRRGRSFGRKRSRGVARRGDNARRTRSAISSGRRSYWPLNQWYSTVTF